MYAKMYKKSTDTIEFFVDFTPYLDSPIVSIDTVTSTSGITVSNEEILTEAVQIGTEQQKIWPGWTEQLAPISIAAGYGIQIEVAGGTTLTEYKITIPVTTEEGSEVVLNVFLLVCDLTANSINGVYTPAVNYYGSVILANEFFSLDPESEWGDLTNAAKIGALVKATKAIDALNFLGYQTDPNQQLQFPRTDWVANPAPNSHLIIPDDICLACYQEAAILGQGDDATGTQDVLSEALGTAKIVYNRGSGSTTPPENILAGINSLRAWMLLKPYLRDEREINLTRVT